ncbi:MAG: aminotransferase class III-fold pyridoxal phosphate-dependent enzyme [Candidatus Woesearchaeota archaeon]|nr:aminotransferase class III-fold pyridoxal phosphate-dependent enzyme [Candidatus Woesearchaeota archaeon]
MKQKPHIATPLPGPKSQALLNKLKRLNIGYNDPYPFVHSGEGSGCYFKDIDGNVFLDFASQIATNPLGYNHPEMTDVVRQLKSHPVKYAGQDFTVKEHVALLEEILTITPKDITLGFLANSGAEAVENCIKLSLRKQKQAKFGISFEGAFHGRTLGALSCTNSKPVQKKNFLFIPMRRVPFDENAVEIIQKMVKRECSPEEVGFIIIEPVQGEGGYRVAPKKLMQQLRAFTKTYDIPLICDEVQSGLGRTGHWWAFEHFGIAPDIMSSAKALQVGAALATKKFRVESGTISSTWGGGHTLDMALGLKTIQVIKEQHLLFHITKIGHYLMKRLSDVSHHRMLNKRGLGLMAAFDLQTRAARNNVIVECARNGLILLGCGEKGIRLIPPYIVTEEEIDIAVEIIERALKHAAEPTFKHHGKICDYLTCGEVHF